MEVICLCSKKCFLAQLRFSLLALLPSVQVTDFLMAGDFRAEAVNGPTTEDGLKPFIWDKFSSISHQGLPQYYNFSFIKIQPLLFEP